MLISPTIQSNSFQRVHFLRKLSKSLINMTDFYATLVIAAKFFKNRTHFNNSKFHINPTRPPCFLNEYVMLMSPTIQYNSFQRVHFLRMLSKSLINMTGFYATLDIAAKFFKNRTVVSSGYISVVFYIGSGPQVVTFL